MVGFLTEDKIKPYLSDCHIVQADNFGLPALVKSWHIDLEVLEVCLIFFHWKEKWNDFGKLSWWKKFI